MHVVGTMHSSPPLLNDSKCFTKLQEFSSCLLFQVPLFQVLRFVLYTLNNNTGKQKSIETQGKITFFFLVLLGGIMPLV